MQIIAHRGASGEFPENTLLAIEQAIAQHADAIEIDVFAVENQLVVIHDHYLQRTTNGIGSIYDYTLAELRRLDAGLGQQIPLLQEVLDILPSEMWLNIELKGDNTAVPLLQLLNEREASGYSLNNLLISSFNHHLLAWLKQQKPQLKLGALIYGLPLDYAAIAQQLQAHSLNCDIGFINQKLVDDAHARGLKVYVYTVDQPDEIDRLKCYGVDGIFTNYPARSRARTELNKNCA